MNFISKKQARDAERWRRLCRLHLPFSDSDSIWRYNRLTRDGEPMQGWKLHIAATAPSACDVFEAVAPFLAATGVQFKSTATLEDLLELNRGLHESYSQVGKFITVYPSSDQSAIELAAKLDELTTGFSCPSIPFDERYSENSCVFYRYGTFQRTETADENGILRSMIRHPDGGLVPDDRLLAVPEWLDDPFKTSRKMIDHVPKTEIETPLNTRYAVLKALTQRGKGGVYKAVDLGSDLPRLCVIKEGRKNGELNWEGVDGCRLIKNERRALKALARTCVNVPRIYHSFELDGCFYLATEWVEGKSLQTLMRTRKRRFSFKTILEISIKIAEMLEAIHSAGWVWNDCKPGNIILTSEGLRPIDFEGSLRFGERDNFDWRTSEFSWPVAINTKADPTADLYALGAVIYYLITGRFIEREGIVPMSRLRQSVPPKLEAIVMKLLAARNGDLTNLTAASVRTELAELLWPPSAVVIDWHTVSAQKTLGQSAGRQALGR